MAGGGAKRAVPRVSRGIGVCFLSAHRFARSIWLSGDWSIKIDMAVQ